MPYASHGCRCFRYGALDDDAVTRFFDLPLRCHGASLAVTPHTPCRAVADAMPLYAFAPSMPPRRAAADMALLLLRYVTLMLPLRRAAPPC